MKQILPIDALLPEIVATLASGRNLVLQAPPGAGKSTRVPPALLDAGLSGNGTILMLEPRRVAARATARRIASERGVTLGDEVGYQVRFDNRTSKETRLAVITEGILTRRLQSDPLLEGVGLVILDEFHERSLHTDLAIAFLRDLQEVRDDLKIVVMSATIATDAIARFLKCSVLESQGRTFDVAIEYVNKPVQDAIPLEAARAVGRLIGRADDDGGDILVFLPGAGEIHQCEAALKPWTDEVGIEVLPLYSALSAEAQDRAIEPGLRRKIVLATNIAETSLTIDGVTSVIDSGLVRQLRMSPASGLDQLELTTISLASARQRAGRAGRTRAGRALRLWTQAAEHRMAEFDAAEITRVDVVAPILEVIAWSGADPANFGWFEAPAAHAIGRARVLLEQLGALEPGAFRLTPLGRQLLELPAHPRLARMLVEGARTGCADEVSAMAAIVSERDFVISVARDAPDAESDLLLRAEILADAAAGRTLRTQQLGFEIHTGRARRTREIYEQLKKALKTARIPVGPESARSPTERA
ncbi:MAG: ATP-dependent RNA helicase, partial [Bradymonadaceae bacterium]|nr:ATP-dependent RNA helicase [Lujinxingiaceae bacterium]